MKQVGWIVVAKYKEREGWGGWEALSTVTQYFHTREQCKKYITDISFDVECSRRLQTKEIFIQE